MIIIDLTVLRTHLMHLLVIQAHNLKSDLFEQLFYDYTDDLQQVQLVHRIIDNAETSIEPFSLDVRHCFIQYR